MTIPGILGIPGTGWYVLVRFGTTIGLDCNAKKIGPFPSYDAASLRAQSIKQQFQRRHA